MIARLDHPNIVGSRTEACPDKRSPGRVLHVLTNLSPSDEPGIAEVKAAIKRFQASPENRDIHLYKLEHVA